ncbi:MAG: hypothetical protein NVV82_04545 [Sporocytophaga sp.]|nr:hypothetical protein [Sporocytophaga sp.]
MEALEKAKLALKKYLLENKEKVAADLDEMRKKSEGKDIYNYIDIVSSAFSFEEVTLSKEVIYDYSFQKIDCYHLINEWVEDFWTLPSKEGTEGTKKTLKFFQSLFFL